MHPCIACIWTVHIVPDMFPILTLLQLWCSYGAALWGELASVNACQPVRHTVRLPFTYRISPPSEDEHLTSVLLLASRLLAFAPYLILAVFVQPLAVFVQPPLGASKMEKLKKAFFLSCLLYTN